MTTTVLADAAIQRFKTRLTGTIHRRGDDGYDAARKVWNAGLPSKCLSRSSSLSVWPRFS